MLPMPTNCHSNRPIEIYKGDDSGAFAVRKIRITLTTPIKMFGATAEFSLLSYRKTFSDAEIAANTMEIEFSSDVTKNFPLGICFGSFKVVDVTGMTLTMTSRIPFLVKLPGSDNAVLSGGVSIPVCDRHDGRVVIPSDVSTIKIQYETSYNQLTDKPSINGVTVSGDKSLQDYGMASAAELAAEKARAEEAERELAEGKVDKEEGKGLSSNDFTNAEKEKLGGIEDGAQKNRPWSETIPSGGIPRADLSRDVRASLTRADNAASKAELEALDDSKADWGTKLADYRIADAYTKDQVDEKLERSEAHYLTKRVVVEGGYEFAPFDTIDELEECVRTHEEQTNPKFFYAGQAHTPDKNDYCVVLSDRTHNQATARYMFVGVFGEGGEFQYQYSISQTAFTPEQWATITGGPYLKLTSATQQTVVSDVRVAGTLTVDKNLDVEDDGLVERKALADDFDAAKTYAVGDYVFRLGDLYECIAEVSTPGEWTYDANWKKINLKDVAQSGGSVGQAPFRSLSKVSDYLYEAVYGTLDEKAAEAYMREHFANVAASLGACTSVSVGKFFGRNYDWKYDDSVTFAVRTAATDSRHAAVSVCRSPFGVTRAKIESGDVDFATWSVIPYLALDGINDAGVVVSMNVVHGKEGDSPWTGTEVCAVSAVRYALDNAATAQEAANLIATKVWMPEPEKMGGYAVHYLVCDGTKKFIVEDGVAHEVSSDEKVGVTNFRVKTGDEFVVGGVVNLDLLAAFDPYGTGVERYNAILGLVPGTITSATAMDAFMRSLYFSECYEENSYGGSQRPSEFAGSFLDGSGVRVKVNETDKIQDWFIAENIHARWVSRARDGEFWQTVHSTTYDIENLSLRIRTQESEQNECSAKITDLRLTANIAATESGKAADAAAVAAKMNDKRDKNDLSVYKPVFGKWKHSDVTLPEGWRFEDQPETSVETGSTPILSWRVLDQYDEFSGAFRGGLLQEDAESVMMVWRGSSEISFDERIVATRTPVGVEESGHALRSETNNICAKDGYGAWTFSDGVTRTLYCNYDNTFNKWAWNDKDPNWDDNYEPPSGCIYAYSSSPDVTRLELHGYPDPEREVIATKEIVAASGESFVTPTGVRNLVKTDTETRNVISGLAEAATKSKLSADDVTPATDPSLTKTIATIGGKAIKAPEGGGGGGSQGYAFVDLTPTTESGYKVFAAQDHAINRFTLADATPVKVILPNATDANGRDFILKVNVTSATMPTFEIVKPSDAASVGIEAADDGWADLEAGINYFTITETDRA